MNALIVCYADSYRLSKVPMCILDLPMAGLVRKNAPTVNALHSSHSLSIFFSLEPKIEFLVLDEALGDVGEPTPEPSGSPHTVCGP
jgi:hypothetical protein